MTANDTSTSPLEPSRPFRLDWIFAAIFRPRPTFAAIAAQAGGVWLAPVLLLTMFALARALVTGYVQQTTIQPGPFVWVGPSGAGEPPPELSSEQQGQFQQVQSFASNPFIVYILPAILAVGGVWLGWLIVGAVLHLVFTLLGGRGSTRSSLNIVAWASLPYVLRDLVRIIYVLAAGRLIQNPGLSGFALVGDGGVNALCAGLLGLVDLYLIWHVLLIGLGLRASEGVTPAKAWGGAAATVAALLALQALPAFLANRLGALATGGF